MLQGSDSREVGGAVSGRGWGPGMARQWDETELNVLGGDVSVVGASSVTSDSPGFLCGT